MLDWALGLAFGLAPFFGEALAFGEAPALARSLGLGWLPGAEPFPEAFDDECVLAGAFGTAGNWITLRRDVDATAA